MILLLTCCRNLSIGIIKCARFQVRDTLPTRQIISANLRCFDIYQQDFGYQKSTFYQVAQKYVSKPKSLIDISILYLKIKDFECYDPSNFPYSDVTCDSDARVTTAFAPDYGDIREWQVTPILPESRHRLKRMSLQFIIHPHRILLAIFFKHINKICTHSADIFDWQAIWYD